MRRTNERKWTDKNIKQGILNVMNALNITRMPTRKEINMVVKNYSLSCAIARSKGYYGWAKELNLPIKYSETTLGKQNEYDIKTKLENLGYEVEKMKQNYPFDLLVNKNVKIDVKASKLYKGPAGDFYTFNLEKKYASCDIYIAICLAENNNIEKLLIIPASKLKITQLSVGKKSKYDIYKDNYKVINLYDDFYKELENAL